MQQRTGRREQPGAASPLDHKFRLRTERCESCIYRVKYDKRTRDRILGDCEARDAYVQCHSHDLGAQVCCAGYYNAVGESGCTAVQLAIRLTRLGLDVIEHVTPEMYPPTGDEEDDG